MEMTTPPTALVNPAEHDHFTLRQRWAPMVNKYEFTVPGRDGSPDLPVCFVQQKRFKFKEDIRFYADATKTVELMRIKARQRFDPRARYDITDPNGYKIGEIQKVFGESLLRSTYRIYDVNGAETAKVTESSMAVALIRRFVGFVPYIGGFADFLPIPYHFVFLRGDYELGTNRRRLFKIRDTYDIDLSGDPNKSLDRRLVLAAVVGMDALQAR
ncbi:MAG: hypothetical protein QOE06_1771 [Thermoleophilaceae bacterium]|jgi:uncharacterized protein YxjI|nr:hypothetical protein [Thermoleophilaceae bacterium]